MFYKTFYPCLLYTSGALTNPNKLQKTFKSVNNSRITPTTITKYIDYLKDAFIIEEANRYDIKGKSYIGTPMKYYFMDMGLRNARINYRQQEVTHAMENVIYNELRVRGFKVDVGNLNIVEKGEDGKKVKKQLEVDFICRKGSKRYYIQSAYMLPTEEKMLQEIRPFLKINDSFKKIIITSNTPKPDVYKRQTKEQAVLLPYSGRETGSCRPYRGSGTVFVLFKFSGYNVNLH